MKIIHVTSIALTLAFALVFSSAASAQEIVRKEAPPEIRALFQAFVAGANGDAGAWESFAQAHFTAELLKKETPAQRAEVHKKIQDKFGTIAINGVRRENDGPLQVIVKGSKSEGEVSVDLDFGSSKIFSIGVQ